MAAMAGNKSIISYFILASALQAFLVSTTFAVLREPMRHVNSTSCEDRCGAGAGPVPEAPCQCNTACNSFGDCCTDYADLCVATCEGKCGQAYVPGAICQCNVNCREGRNCCKDFQNLCGGITDAELAELTEELLELDINNAAQYVTVNIESNPLLTLRPEVYDIPTIAKYRLLFDNYFPWVSESEIVTPEELTEDSDFINHVFSMPVMRRAQEFLAEHGLPNGRSHFARIWFGLYNRGGGRLGSSGFEHVFLGELWARTGISGFHNWIYFANEEAAGRAVNGDVFRFLDLGKKGWIIENSMSWQNQSKPLGGGFIGTSPEFELAIYTVCWNVRPNGLCPISLNGRSMYIQSYETLPSHSNVTVFVSTAFTDISQTPKIPIRLN